MSAIEKMRRALQWIVDSPGAHPANMVGVARDALTPDHARQVDGPPYASDDWQAKGYSSPAEEIDDMANVGRTLIEVLPEGYSYMDSPAEIVTDLQNELDELRQQHATPADGIRRALERMVYEATHLSPCKPNGDHDCTIKADALAQARAALSTASPPRSLETAKPGTLAYAEAVHADMTSPDPKKGETAQEATARHDYYRGYDDDGLPCD